LMYRSSVGGENEWRNALGMTAAPFDPERFEGNVAPE